MNNAIVPVLLFLLTIITGMAAYSFKTWRDEMKEQMQALVQEQGEQGRHMTAMIHSIWNLTWRMNGVEDFLQQKMDFHPPRIIGEGEAFGREKQG